MTQKLTQDILRMLNRLADEDRDKVDKIVKRHVAACLRNGFQPENLERVFIEAVEQVKLEKLHPEPVAVNAGPRDYYPRTSYPAYVSPRAE